MKLIHKLGVSIAIVLGLNTSPCHGQILGVDFAAPGPLIINGPYTVGFEFAVNTPIAVSGLADWNPTAGGNEVGLWNVSGTLLASADVTTSSPTIGNADLNYTAIAPVVLSVGDYYVGAVAYSGESLTWNVSGMTTIPQITYLTPEYAVGATLTFPTAGAGGATTGYFGGDFVESAIPEPGTIGLLGLGIASLVLFRRKIRV